jgi:hypothetical protein
MTEGDPTWITVRCQGGIVGEDWQYETLIEPPAEIEVIKDPFHPGCFIRVLEDWDESVTYVRVSQRGDERIYRPKEAVA